MQGEESFTLLCYFALSSDRRESASGPRGTGPLKAEAGKATTTIKMQTIGSTMFPMEPRTFIVSSKDGIEGMIVLERQSIELGFPQNFWVIGYADESHSSRLIFAFLKISARRLAPISSP
jgi:hypothetical protein